NNSARRHLFGGAFYLPWLRLARTFSNKAYSCLQTTEYFLSLPVLSSSWCLWAPSFLNNSPTWLIKHKLMWGSILVGFIWPLSFVLWCFCCISPLVSTAKSV